jgi:hypothetical protein
MSSKQITMSYAEYQQELADSRRLGWHDAQERLQRIMKLTKGELELQRYEPDHRRGPESDILREIFEHFFMD